MLISNQIIHFAAHVYSSQINLVLVIRCCKLRENDTNNLAGQSADTLFWQQNGLYLIPVC